MYNVILIDDDERTQEVVREVIEITPIELELLAVVRVKDLSNLATTPSIPEIIIVDSGDANKNLLSLNNLLLLENSKIITLNENAKNALGAMKMGACDYLIKPINTSRLSASLVKAAKLHHTEQISLQERLLFTGNGNFLAVSSNSQIEFLEVEKILYCEARGRYTLFYTENRKQIVSTKNLGFYEMLLERVGFFRVHHRIMINLNMVRYINTGRNAICVLKTGKQLPISKRKFEILRKTLNLK